MSAAKNRLRIKRLDTVGFVDRGDDPLAEVVFFKRHIAKKIVEENGKFCVYSEDGSQKLGEHDTLEAAEAQLRAIEANKLRADGAASLAKTQAPHAEDTMSETHATDEVAALLAKIEELEAKLNPPAPAPLPADVQKRIDETEKRANDLAEQVQKLQDQREAEEYIAKARALGLNADDFGPIMRKIAKALSGDEMKTLEQMLKGYAEQARQSGLFAEIGRGGIPTTETDGQVDALVDTMRAANPGWTAERARGEVMKQHPDLRRALEAERLARHSRKEG